MTDFKPSDLPVFQGSEVDRLKAIIADLDERCQTALKQRNALLDACRVIMELDYWDSFDPARRDKLKAALEKI
jgi:hypothetical protein